MKILKKAKIHIIAISVLIIIAGLAEGIVRFYFDELQAHPITLNRLLTIYPLYNKNGSWLHGRLGIGYARWLLITECMVIFLMLFFLFRYMKAFVYFFHMSTLWLHIPDFAFAALIYRLFTHIRSSFVLDYLDLGKSVYDFPDLYIGIMTAGVLLWLTPAVIKYYRYRKVQVKEMGFIKKQIWDLKIAGLFFKAAVIPESKWADEFAPWQQ